MYWHNASNFALRSSISGLLGALMNWRTMRTRSSFLRTDVTVHKVGHRVDVGPQCLADTLRVSVGTGTMPNAHPDEDRTMQVVDLAEPALDVAGDRHLNAR
jgi:hypothetical protein